jgi:SAM-dependent methyltransferase
MSGESGHYRGVAAHYDRLAGHGVYGTLAPHNRGGRKGQYVAAVFDAAMLPLLAERRFSALLDFGCGTGIFACQAAGLVEKVVGVDVSSGILDVARSTCAGASNIDLLLTDGEHLPFDDASFDCVVARETLCYVPDSRFPAVLAEMGRVLRPSGALFVIDQVSDDPYWQHYAGTPHQVKRAPEAMRTAATTAGFVLRDEYVIRTPRFPAVYLAWSGLLPRRFMRQLARLEIGWHRRRSQPTHRWWDSLFVFAKPS